MVHHYHPSTSRFSLLNQQLATHPPRLLLAPCARSVAPPLGFSLSTTLCFFHHVRSKKRRWSPWRRSTTDCTSSGSARREKAWWKRPQRSRPGTRRRNSRKKWVSSALSERGARSSGRISLSSFGAIFVHISGGCAFSLSEEIERRLTILDSSKNDEAKEVEAVATLPPTSKKGLRHPPRPGFGTAGERRVVRANHFLIEVADKDLFHYDVSVTPECKSRATNRKVISELVKLHKDGILGTRIPAYDGRKSLYTAGALPFEVKDFTIKFPETSQRREKEFKVTIRLAGHPSLHNLREFLVGKQLEMPQDVVQVLDVVLRESPSSKYTCVARSFFSPVFGQPNKIGNGLECWRGYYQSLRPTQMGLSLNIDTAATSFYKSDNVAEFVAEYLNLHDVSRPLSEQDRSKIKKVLRGVRVETIHRKDSSACHRITGITPGQMKDLNFSIDEQQNSISVVQYFMGRYKWNLKYVSWPCLQAGSDRNPTYLPMEVCKIVEGQRYSKKLNEKQVTEILRATCQPPEVREKRIMEMVYQNNYTNDNYSNDLGIRMKCELTSVAARVLNAPTLMYHDSSREKSCRPRGGHWNMINKKMVNGGSVEYWACLNFASRLRQDEVFRFCEELIRMCNSIGMDIKPSPFVEIRSDRPDRLEHALRNVNNRSLEELERRGIIGKHIQLLVVILPEISSIYGRIKRICETELAIVSQCCLPKHVPCCNRQYLENVALKINVKAGGRNTVLEEALYRRLPLVTDRPTIIFGADVTHPPPGEDSSSSIAAVVASTDWPEITKYRGLFSAQPHREEMIKDLFIAVENEKKEIVYGGMIRELLITFYRSTKHKPDRIIFYRDGVSEGQFRHVLLFELDAIKRACASLEDGYLPPVTFVVVQKRHHTRLFPQVHGNRSLTHTSGNILPGTVVDRKICHPTEFDFYLCSHAGIQGTSRPTHYHVLADENKFTADGLQILTNSLCYTYARCTRSVSVVPPVYYAHLAAFRARYYMEGELSDGSGSGRVRDMPADVRQLPQVQDKVKEVMFFC